MLTLFYTIRIVTPSIEDLHGREIINSTCDVTDKFVMLRMRSHLTLWVGSALPFWNS